MCLGDSMSSEPRYSDYTLEELYDALEHIEHDKYPERVEKIKDIIEIKAKELPSKKESKKLKPKEQYLVSIFIVGFVIILTIALGFIPMKGLSWLTKEEKPLYYWTVVSGLIFWALFYVNKYRRV